jgi:methylmalonyl-CoA mutase
LVLFKDIEANGGFLKQLNEGVIKRNPGKDKEQELLIQEKKSLGTNKYQTKTTE